MYGRYMKKILIKWLLFEKDYVIISTNPKEINRIIKIKLVNK